MNENNEYLPLSYLNHLEYCPRRFWLMYVQGEMEINAAVLEGIQQHEKAHTPGVNTDGETTVHRQLYVWSDRLRILGFADVVEDQDGLMVPVEYKRGKRGKWLNDHIQLCAQALCLEERTGNTIAHGEIFYWRSRRREKVALTTALRTQTEATIQRAFALLETGQLPRPIDEPKKCRDCSLEPICLPQETTRLIREA